jgi:hypothetical membrane protein|tara:strand:- start:3273 stop:3989 length:717 start_codon:yes stop_codon:yes gene_type:complete
MSSKERLLFFILPLTAIVVFVLLVITGALAYDGGNRLDHHSVGYSFSNNYLSDLGRLKTVSGIANTVPYYCFNGALIMLSAVFSFYFLYLPSLYDNGQRVQNISRIGSVCGFLASICFAGVAFTPVDLFFSAHVFFADWLYRLMNLSIIFYAVSFMMMPKKLLILSSLFGLIGLAVGSHVILSDFGAAELFSEPHTVRVLSQKAATIALVFSVPLMTAYNRERINSHPVMLRPFALSI